MNKAQKGVTGGWAERRKNNTADKQSAIIRKYFKSDDL